LNPLRENHVDNYALTFYSVIDADVFTADGRLADDEPFRKSGPLLGRVRWRWQRQLRSRLNTVSHEVGCVLGCAVFYAAAKAQEVLHFWCEFAAVKPSEVVAEGGSFYLPDDVAVFGIAVPYS
jgi:hypothetical protein